ncbi:M81 family metallopeptidase [Fodinicurvata fenggangensis]|uniref:M81 family metallopeptidase n=1 Tax=Fodinicurvata fenggangensis TaxID=1121830 RepID=UPI0004799BAC|nr:M81 family metallopeptidase [Fodinicurvata fenggangensis]
MRLLLAMMKHETNTFSPVPTKIERFARRGNAPLRGADAIAAYSNTGTVLCGYMDEAAEAGAEIEVAIAAEAWPSGPVDDEAYRIMSDAICEAVEKGGWDGILLDLHGAMVTESQEDGEGTLVRRVRELAPDTPIAVGLDMHANLYDEIVSNSNVVAGYQTYPHIDMYETGRRAGRALIGQIKGEVKPTQAWANNPMLPHVMRQGTDDHPNKEIQARCIEMEKRPEVLSASLFVGFPHADIREAGLSAVVVTDNDPDLAEQLRDELLDMAWKEREAFVYHLEPLADSVSRAKAIPRDPQKGPVILLDHFDNAASGGTMDTTAVLAEILKQELEDVAIFGIYDPEAVQQAVAAGIGETVTLKIGGKMDMPAIPAENKPLEVTGRVKTISEGRYRNKGPMYAGVAMDMGTAVVLDTGKVDIVVISRHVEPHDINVLLSLGIDPMQKRYVMLKSRIHWRAGLKHIARDIIECAGIGVCTSDYSQLNFSKVRRPIYPLDDISDRHAS